LPGFFLSTVSCEPQISRSQLVPDTVPHPILL
jgi:hypothetical protein